MLCSWLTNRLIHFDRLIVRLERLREKVGTVVLRYEVEKRHASRMQCRFDRGETWITDRTGRETWDAVGVVRICIMQILFRQVAAKMIESVNDPWVALNRHMTLHCIRKHRRDG